VLDKILYVVGNTDMPLLIHKTCFTTLLIDRCRLVSVLATMRLQPAYVCGRSIAGISWLRIPRRTRMLAPLVCCVLCK